MRGNNLIVYDINSSWKKSLAVGITAILSVVLIILIIKPARANHYYNCYVIARSESNEAISNLEKAVNLNSLNALYHYKLSLEYLKKKPQNKYIKNSLKEIKQAIYLNSTNAKYHLTLAVFYSQLANRPITHRPSDDDYIKLTHQEFQQAIYLAPNTPYGHKNYADWLFTQPIKENIEKGIIEYKKALTLKPEIVEEILIKYSKYQKNYEKVIEILPETEESDCAVLKFLIKEKCLKFAIDFAEKFLKTYPDNAEIHFLIADKSFYDKSFPWEFTEQHYNIAFRNSPNNSYYRMWYGIHLCHRYEYEKAFKNLEKALEMGLVSENKKQAKKYMAKCSILDEL